MDERPIHALYESPRHVIRRVRVFLDFASTLLGSPRSWDAWRSPTRATQLA
ncbi:hypothetical protein [Sorangium sp. So ce426]|uniref:hypothetical protein n=1 Tax=Sorangium sp. So ce426 TaxID=3133312 RepID=UPI003F5B63B4